MDSQLSRKRLIFLVLRAQAGDRDAMDRLLESHQGGLFGYLLKMLGDRTDAENVLQATLLQAARKLKWLREPEYFRAWMYRIASRNAYRVIDRRNRKKEFSNSDFIDVVSDQEVDDSELRDLIEQIPLWLERLTLNGREVVILHYLKSFRLQEVADILDIPLGTVKSRISYSLACIRKQIANTKE